MEKSPQCPLNAPPLRTAPLSVPPLNAPLYTQEAFQRAAGHAWRPGGEALTRYALDVCAFAPGARVLDVGCGPGDTLALLHERGVWACGLDVRLPAPDVAAHEARDLPRILGDGAALPMGAATLDGIVCQCVLSLLPPIPGAGAALRGMARALRPSGLLLLSDVYVRTPSGPCGPDEAMPCASPRTACWQGAISWEAQGALLAAAGLSLVLAEDHSAALRELAARMVWYGVRTESLPQWLGRKTACARGYGYGLWIARKDGTCRTFS